VISSPGGETSDLPIGCDDSVGSATDVAREPNWRMYGDYRDWKTTDGCQVRIDVMAERTGTEHCGFEAASVIITGIPFGARYTDDSNDAQYVRDPENVFGDLGTSMAFDPDAELPSGAVDTGLREGRRELWVVPGDASSVYLVTGDVTERWPLDPEPAGCI
jgi:hypothetical protein